MYEAKLEASEKALKLARLRINTLSAKLERVCMSPARLAQAKKSVAVVEEAHQEIIKDCAAMLCWVKEFIALQDAALNGGGA